VTDYRKLFDLTGKTAVVLGAASGIGKSSAETLARLGAHVICADRDHERCQATAAGIREGGGMADPIACDAASAAEVAALAESVKAKFPRLDIAVTTPGMNVRKTGLDYTEEDLDRVINLNIKGTVHFFRAFGRIMVDQRGGSLIACSSVRAVTIEPGLAVYGCTKAAIGLLVKGFASEVGSFGVCVNAIAPQHRRDRAHRTIQAATRHVQALRRAHGVQSLEFVRRGCEREHLALTEGTKGFLDRSRLAMLPRCCFGATPLVGELPRSNGQTTAWPAAPSRA
jgi:NAD(P)-dependent dehydrogenase (short-subunit alcohol dehydrogenase family)